MTTGKKANEDEGRRGKREMRVVMNGRQDEGRAEFTRSSLIAAVVLVMS